MRTKQINVVFEEVKVAVFDVDLKDLENYMSKFLALKNHQRHTDEILEVRGRSASTSTTYRERTCLNIWKGRSR